MNTSFILGNKIYVNFFTSFSVLPNFTSLYTSLFKSIAFNATDNSIDDYIMSNMGEMFSLIVAISKNTWLDNDSIELRIEDVIKN